MKFKSPSWDATPKDVAEFRQANAHHLEKMRGVLLDHVLELATLPGLEDGLIEEYVYDKNDHILRLVLLCGYLQMGYYDLIITYQGAEISPEHEETLKHFAQSIDEHICLHRFEVDITEDNQIEHRLEFFTSDGKVWFAIRCEGLSWETVERPKQEFSPRPSRFYPDRTS
ncbi:MAG: hypothetical protein QXI19_14505 [Candidatus Caldarchaeum sp.]